MNKKKIPYIARKKPVRPVGLPLIPQRIKTTVEQAVYLLDSISEEDIDRYKLVEEGLQDYFIDEHFYFSSQRTKRFVQLSDALNKKTSSLVFQNHYRCVSSQYNLSPLSSRGSRVSAVGGRFNFGSIGNSFPSFPALYLGENIVTSRTEFLQKDPRNLGRTNISLEDFIGQSVSDIRVHGNLQNLLDLTERDSLKPFLKGLQKIEISQDILDKAIRAGLSASTKSIKKMKELEDALLGLNWRMSVARFNIPANCQSFGSLVRAAGIEAIKYRSKYARGYCLAVFPENLNQGSFVELSDPSANGVIRRLDEKTYSQLV